MLLRIAFLTLALSLCCGQLVSQNINLDSLIAEMKERPDDTAKVRQLFETSEFLYLKDIEKEGVCLRQGYALARKLGDDGWYPRFESHLGANFANSSQPDSALHYFNLAKNGFEKQGNQQQLAKVLSKMRWVYNFLGDYETALDYAYRALALYEKTGDEAGIARANSFVGEVLYSQENYEEAKNYGQKAYEKFKALDNKLEIAHSAQSLGDAWLQLNDYDKALAFQNESLSLRRALGAEIDIALSLNSRGNVLKYMERYPEALNDYRESLKIARETKFDGLVQTCLSNIGNVYNLMGEYRKALPYHLERRSIFMETGNLSRSAENLKHLSEAYEQLGITDSALYFQKLYSDLRDSLLPEETRTRMAELQTKYETAQRDAKIALQEEQLKEERIRFWAAIAVLALAIIAGGALYNLTKKLRQRNEEKEFLIKEIHHRVKNNLQVLSSLLYLQSRHIKDDAALDAVREGQSRVEAMGLIHQKLYMGDNLASVEMRDYLHNLGNTLLETFRLDEDRIRIIYHLEPMYLDVNTAIPLGLIINELVTNSLKYAFPGDRAGLVEISLWKNDAGKLCLKVTDDGVGKEAAPELKDSTSFGTSLVQMLSKKLKGKPQILHENGYATLIEFEKYKIV